MAESSHVNPSTPWYESNILWAPLSLAAGVILVVAAAKKHDLRWLLWFAWPFFGVASWWLARRTREVIVLTALGIALAGIGLLWLNDWLSPIQEASNPTAPGAPNGGGNTPKLQPAPAKTTSTVEPAPEAAAKKPGSSQKKPNGSAPTSPSTTIIQTATAPCVAQANGGNATISGCGEPNPYKGVVTWTPNGFRHTTLGLKFETFAPFAEPVFTTLSNFQEKDDWEGMLNWTLTQQNLYPDWFTPDEYAGLSSANLCHRDQAIANLNKFISETIDASDYKKMRDEASNLLTHAQSDQYAALCHLPKFRQP